MAKYPGLPLPKAALRVDLWVANIIQFKLETAPLGHRPRQGLPDYGLRRNGVFQAVEASLCSPVPPPTPRVLAHFDTLSAEEE